MDRDVKQNGANFTKPFCQLAAGLITDNGIWDACTTLNERQAQPAGAMVRNSIGKVLSFPGMHCEIVHE
jgi:hypothetical protein